MSSCICLPVSPLEGLLSKTHLFMSVLVTILTWAKPCVGHTYWLYQSMYFENDERLINSARKYISIQSLYSFLSYFFVKKIPLSRRVEYVMDGSTGLVSESVSQWVSESVRDVCMSHQSDRIYYKQPIKFLVLKANSIWEDLIPIQFRTAIFMYSYIGFTWAFSVG